MTSGVPRLNHERASSSWPSLGSRCTGIRNSFMRQIAPQKHAALCFSGKPCSQLMSGWPCQHPRQHHRSWLRQCSWLCFWCAPYACCLPALGGHSLGRSSLSGPTGQAHSGFRSSSAEQAFPALLAIPAMEALPKPCQRHQQLCGLGSSPCFRACLVCPSLIAVAVGHVHQPGNPLEVECCRGCRSCCCSGGATCAFQATSSHTWPATQLQSAHAVLWAALCVNMCLAGRKRRVFQFQGYQSSGGPADASWPPTA